VVSIQISTKIVRYYFSILQLDYYKKSIKARSVQLMILLCLCKIIQVVGLGRVPAN